MTEFPSKDSADAIAITFPPNWVDLLTKLHFPFWNLMSHFRESCRKTSKVTGNVLTIKDGWRESDPPSYHQSVLEIKAE